MERIIRYEEIPYGKGTTVYLKMETDPRLYLSLLRKGYNIISDISLSDDETIFLTGRRQDYECFSFDQYKLKVNRKIQKILRGKGVTKPKTLKFSFNDLVNYNYKLPFVLKNENLNGGKEKFLIETEQDYENLIKTCNFLFDRDMAIFAALNPEEVKYRINYASYLANNFVIQEYIPTPSKYNTTVRLLTTPAGKTLYGSLKYNVPEAQVEHTTLLGYLLKEEYPLSNGSIVSNTLSGGQNLLIGEDIYTENERILLRNHNIDSDKFYKLVKSSEEVHALCMPELGILCGFDYIYDVNRDKWYLLEYHSRPMVGDYAKRQGLDYETREDRIRADGRVRATALSLVLKK